MPAGAARPESLMQNTRRLLARLDTRAKKSLGQHFLIDAGVLRKIVEAAELSHADTVVEVGPGLGVLTAELARHAGNVIAVELDDSLAPLLRQTLSWASNLTVVHDDVLKVSPSELLRAAGTPAADGYKVVANLPYYITSAVLRHFLESDAQPSLMVVMVQKEVARAITAQPGDMSLLSVAVQLYGEARAVARVPAGSFFPAPKVDSAVLKIRLRRKPLLSAADVPGFFTLVRAGFCANRKQMVNSLAQGLPVAKEEVYTLLEEAGIEPRRRAESLAIPEWLKLWQAFNKGAWRC